MARNRTAVDITGADTNFGKRPMSRDAPLFAFDNSYARLPERFFARVAPTATAEPGLVRFNASLARQLGVNPERLASDEALEVFAGNRVPEGSDPIATAYAGFQFGNWVPQLGDGRAILLGEVVCDVVLLRVL
jgi:uncharacterized protein YdiU (UPF0061 family)